MVSMSKFVQRMSDFAQVSRLPRAAGQCGLPPTPAGTDRAGGGRVHALTIETSRTTCPPRCWRGGFLAACVLLWLFASGARAQEFVRTAPPLTRGNPIPPPGVSSTDDLDTVTPAAKPSTAPDALSAEDTNRMVEQYRQEAGPLGPSRLFSVAKWGFFAGVGVAYDDNIRITSGPSKEADEITTLSGGLSLSLGDYLKRQAGFLLFKYALTENLFAVHSSENSLDQDGSLDARYDWDRFSVELMSGFREVHDPVSDVAQRERRYDFDEALTLRYHYGDKTTFLSRFSFDRSDPQFEAANQQYSWENAADYQVMDKVKLGVGAVIGRLQVEGQRGETFGQPLVRFAYEVTDKIYVLAQGGADIRNRGTIAGQMVTPVFAVEGRWTPDDDTTVSVNGFRRVDASESITGDDFVNSTIEIYGRRQFLHRYYALASAGYTHGDYEQVTLNNQPSREDNYFSVRVGLGFQAAKYLDFGLFYLHRRNDSSLGAYSYTSNRVYLQSNLVF